MVEKMISLIISKLEIEQYYSEVEREKIQFTLMALTNDFTKLLMIICLAIVTGYTNEFIVAFLTTTLLRIIVGGFHLKKYWSCFLFSSVYYFVVIKLSYIYINANYLTIFCLILSFILICLTPSVSKQRKNINKTDITTYKVIVTFIVIFYLAIYIINKDPLYSIGLWSIILQSIQLIFMKGMSIYEKIYEKQVVA